MTDFLPIVNAAADSTQRLASSARLRLAMIHEQIGLLAGELVELDKRSKDATDLQGTKEMLKLAEAAYCDTRLNRELAALAGESEMPHAPCDTTWHVIVRIKPPHSGFTIDAGPYLVTVVAGSADDAVARVWGSISADIRDAVLPIDPRRDVHEIVDAMPNRGVAGVRKCKLASITDRL